MKKGYFFSMLFSLVLTTGTGLATVAQAASSPKIGSVIGSADILLSSCKNDTNTNNSTGRVCDSLKLDINNVKGLNSSAHYDVYIADNTCPTSGLGPSLKVISNVQPNSSGVLDTSNTLNVGGFKPLPLTENVCIYDTRKSDATKDTPVAAGHFINHTSSKPGKKGQGTMAHGMVHLISKAS